MRTLSQVADGNSTVAEANKVDEWKLRMGALDNQQLQKILDDPNNNDLDQQRAARILMTQKEIHRIIREAELAPVIERLNKEDTALLEELIRKANPLNLENQDDMKAAGIILKRRRQLQREPMPPIEEGLRKILEANPGGIGHKTLLGKPE